jgi:hypothetical protein
MHCDWNVVGRKIVCVRDFRRTRRCQVFYAGNWSQIFYIIIVKDSSRCIMGKRKTWRLTWLDTRIWHLLSLCPWRLQSYFLNSQTHVTMLWTTLVETNRFHTITTKTPNFLRRRLIQLSHCGLGWILTIWVLNSEWCVIVFSLETVSRVMLQMNKLREKVKTKSQIQLIFGMKTMRSK